MVLKKTLVPQGTKKTLRKKRFTERTKTQTFFFPKKQKNSGLFSEKLKMEDFVKRVDNSWIRDLDENTESETYSPNQTSRQGKLALVK